LISTILVKRSLYFVFFIAVLLLFSIFTNHKPNKAFIHGQTMGTTYSITILDYIKNKNLLEIEINKLLININDIFSTYIDSSEISIVNDLEKTTISEEFSHVLNKALYYCKISNGSYDITIAPLVELWGFSDFTEKNIPSQKIIDEILSKIGYENLKVLGTELNKEKYIKIDLNSIAKGYAVDKIALLLDSMNYRDYLIEVGGEIRASGNNNNDSWIIGIQHPVESSIVKKIKLDNLSMATSGTYNNYFTINNIDYSHILNPKTGYPFEYNSVSSTIIAKNCIDADAYATVAMTQNPVEIISLINKSPNVEGYIIQIKDNKLVEYKSLGFENLIVF